MKNKYNVDDLYVASIMLGHNGTFPLFETNNLYVPEQKYIFERTQDGKYREVFTGFETIIMPEISSYEGIPLILEVEKFTDYFPETYFGKMSKIDLLVALNFIRSIDIEKKETKKEKVMTK